MYIVEVTLIFLILVIVLYILYLYFYRQNIIIFSYYDIPPEPFEDVSSPSPTPTPKSPIATNADYKQFYDWHTSFCTTWNKVIEQSMSTDNYKGSTVDYVNNLQSQQNKTFVKCYDEITADPDPFAIQDKIPTVMMYLSTMNFMAIKISTILRKTKKALQGEPEKEDFEDVPSSKSCGCLSPEAAATAQTLAEIAVANAKKKEEEELRLKKAIQHVIASVQPIVKDKATLEGQLAIINKGLNELLEYKRKAETGEIQNDIKMPD